MIAYTALTYSPLPPDDTNARLIFFLSYLFIGFMIGILYSYLLEGINPDDISTTQFLLYPLLGSSSIGITFTVIDYLFGGLGFPDSPLKVTILFIE
ncbi:MAG: hypothetical protein MUF58_19705, partial [Arcicella sp.]|nr:hypothetical protein [Arcicella sp.]